MRISKELIEALCYIYLENLNNFSSEKWNDIENDLFGALLKKDGIGIGSKNDFFERKPNNRLYLFDKGKYILSQLDKIEFIINEFITGELSNHDKFTINELGYFIESIYSSKYTKEFILLLHGSSINLAVNRKSEIINFLENEKFIFQKNGLYHWTIEGKILISSGDINKYKKIKMEKSDVTNNTTYITQSGSGNNLNSGNLDGKSKLSQGTEDNFIKKIINWIKSIFLT